MTPALHAAWTDIASLGSRRKAWQELADAALEPNPFYGPDFLLAAQAHLQPGQPIRCLIVTDPGNDNRLCGLFPLHRPLISHALLGLAWSLHVTPFTCLTTPLVAADRAQDVIETAMAFLAGEPGPSTLFLSLTAETRPFAQVLRRVVESKRNRRLMLRAHERAAIETDLSLEAYRKERWDRQQRKNHARLGRKLAEAGRFTVEHIPGDAAVAPAVLEAFFHLEAKGWKGQGGTALNATPARKAFAETAFLGEARSQRLFEVLRLDEKLIAIHINLVSHRTAFSIKTAYDPDFAHLGPGRFLDGEAVALAAAGGMFDRMDSCAGPGHPMESAWIEREPVAGWLIDLSGKPESPAFTATAARIRLAARLSAWRHPRGYTTRSYTTRKR